MADDWGNEDEKIDDAETGETALAPTEIGGITQRRDFGGVSLTRDGAATAALVAKARAHIEARWIMAMQRPRVIEQVRQDIMAECRRPGFAAVAIYSKPMGGERIEGLSIRFAEVAARCMTNIDIDVSQIFDDARSRVMRVSVTDLETNVTWPMEVNVPKTVERKHLNKGQKPISSRTNSYGQQVYLVEATDDQIATVQAALISKAARTAILRVIPGNIKDEAMAICRAIAKDKTAKDPAGERQRMCDAYLRVGVEPRQIEEWLGRKIELITPAEIDELRELFSAIRDGEASWATALADRADSRTKAKPPSATTPSATTPQPTAAPAEATQTTPVPASKPAPTAGPATQPRPRGAAALKDQLKNQGHPKATAAAPSPAPQPALKLEPEAKTAQPSEPYDGPPDDVDLTPAGFTEDPDSGDES